MGLKIHILVLVFLFAALSGTAIYLPYTTTIFEPASAEQFSSTPDATGFSIAGVRWDTSHYKSDQALEPLRQYFHRYCPGLTGRPAGECLSNQFAKQFRFDSPVSDAFMRVYDPAKSIVSHEAGEPGECGARSSLAAAVLLSIGIPARLVQLVPGHNIYSVWDEKEGWVALDPTNNSRLTTADGRASEVELWKNPNEVLSFPIGPPPKNSEVAVLNYVHLFSGRLAIVEPWLYTRTGPRYAYWPFRAVLLEVQRPGEWSLGEPQDALRFGLVCIVLWSIVPLAASWRKERKANNQMRYLGRDARTWPSQTKGLE